MPEFDLIDKLRRAVCLPAGEVTPGCAVGIGDDAALLDFPSGSEVVACTDTLVEGIHFPLDTPAEAIGHKALAVNLSDLAAMGAKPAFFLLALTIPGEDPRWLDAFAGGMARLARQSRVQLAGGDTTRGPLSITITALGTVEKGRALLRSGARPGDQVVVSGAPGAAAHALASIRQGEVPDPQDKKALQFPQPRIDLGLALAGLATSCIDVSDGLAADLGHVLAQSGVGAEIMLDSLPCPGSLAGMPEDQRWPLQLSGGDDYELCFTVAPDSAGELERISRTCDTSLTVIGKIVARPGLDLVTRDGGRYQPGSSGFVHFSREGAAS